MFINEIDFHRMFDGILTVVFSFSSGVLHGKSADFPAKNVRCRRISSYVMQPRDRSPDHAVCHCEVIIISMKSFLRLKDQVKNLVYKMFINKVYFHRLLDCIFKVVFLAESYTVNRCKHINWRRMQGVGAYQAT